MKDAPRPAPGGYRFLAVNDRQRVSRTDLIGNELPTFVSHCSVQG
jgi:hypothetical protein